RTATSNRQPRASDTQPEELGDTQTGQDGDCQDDPQPEEPSPAPGAKPSQDDPQLERSLQSVNWDVDRSRAPGRLIRADIPRYQGVINGDSHLVHRCGRGDGLRQRVCRKQVPLFQSLKS